MKKWLSPLPVVALLLSLNSPSLAAPSVSFKQAIADYNAGKYAQALSEFGEHSTAYPGNALVHYYLALCHQALNHRTQAKAEYEFVAQRGDATLQSHAAKGLQVLDAGRASYGSSTPTASAPAAGPPAKNTPPQAGGPGKIKKIIEFYADW